MENIKMTCYDCIHCDACSDAGDSGFSYLKEDVSKCKHFKNKADFVEVNYRCETCKRSKGKVNECGDVYCKIHKGFFDKDAFCSYGERKKMKRNW